MVAFRDEAESETKAGVWEEVITEKKYYGDIIRNARSLNNDSEIIDGINVSNQISLVSDPYATNNFHKIIYLTFMGTKWKARSVEVQYPRLLITLGGLYTTNEE